MLAILGLYGILPLAGALTLDLYRLYSIAAVLGWASGNVYLLRLKSLTGQVWRRRLLLSYLLGPASCVYLLRALAPITHQLAAPLVPILSLAVYGIFFLVPVTLRGTQVQRQ